MRTSDTDKPVLHGRDHGPGGSDPFTSRNATEGEVVEADGEGGIRWGDGGTGGDGIQFNTNNIGGYLRVFTTGDDGAQGIWLNSTEGSNAKVLISSDDNDVELQAERDINFGANGDIFSSATDTATFKTLSGALVLQGATSGALTVSNGDLTLRATVGDVIVVLGVGKSFSILDNDGDPVFRVDDDGSVHIKTGTSIVADL